jgi:hypothetical protein
MLNTVAVVFVASVLSSTSSTVPTVPTVDYSTAYQACTEALNRQPEDIADVLAKCEEPANGGVPGAEYAVGAMLVARNSGNDMTRGVEWLEKAVAAGSPPAAYHLAGVLVSKKTEESITRGRELFKYAVCAGYPPALSELEREGVSKASISCAPDTDTDFTGEWIVSLRWDKKAPAVSTESYRVSIAGGTARVSMKIGGAWTEVKPGKFSLAQQEQSLTVSTMDSGWDSDGKWIESWNIQFMRTGADEATVAFLRTVNNPYLPPRFGWRTFSNFVEGTAHRVKP